MPDPSVPQVGVRDKDGNMKHLPATLFKNSLNFKNGSNKTGKGEDPVRFYDIDGKVRAISSSLISGI